MSKKNQELFFHEDFQKLMMPLSQKAMDDLEETIVNTEVVAPINVWNGYIVDGAERYKICREYGIDYLVRKMPFRDISEAIIWICKEQLKRDDLSLEFEHYLIGMRFRYEKNICSRYYRGQNQFTHGAKLEPDPDDIFGPYTPPVEASAGVTKKRVAAEHCLSWATVDKYYYYAIAIDEIRVKAPEIAEMLVSGKVRISHENTIDLSHLEEKALKRAFQNILSFAGTGRDDTGKFNGTAVTAAPVPGIKKMPKYNPDSELVSLTITIPSWSKSIERKMDNTNTNVVSVEAKGNLLTALHNLKATVENAILKLS